MHVNGRRKGDKMPTPNEIFEYVEKATETVYDNPDIPNGYSTDEEKEVLYTVIANALVEAEEEEHFLDDMTEEEFEEAFLMMEDENFHSECAALAFIAHRNGLSSYIIEQEADCFPFLFEE